MKNRIYINMKRKSTLISCLLIWLVFINMNANGVNLPIVGVNVAAGLITNTTTDMEYSLNSTNGSNGTWNTAGAGNTIVDYSTGGFDVWVRETALPSNKRKVATIATQASAPAITINFTAETTTQTIASTIEYSTSLIFISSTTGSGATVTLNPATTYYFRIKATTTAVASAIKTLTVPARPATPAYTIDFINETTNEITPSTDEYSSSISMTYPTSGNGAKKNIYPGQTLYFRTKATTSAYKSLIQTLVIPVRPETPAYTINYMAETTSQVVPSTDEYSTSSDMTSRVTGNDAVINLTPGQTIYLRTKASATTFKSLTQELVVPARPATPGYTIDYVTEKTVETVPANEEYSVSSNMENAISGNGTSTSIVPGQNLYFRKKATDSSFQSQIFTLVVPDRPTQPSYSINFAEEITNEPVSVTHEFSTSANMGNAVSGVNQKVALSAGQNLYFRKKATSTTFSSAIFELTVPARPAAPSYSTDYNAETTNEAIALTDQYSSSPSLSNPSDGIGEKIRVYPGENLYFYSKATTSSFKSSIQMLTVPARPLAPSYSIDYKQETTAEVVPSSVSFSYSADMSGPVVGSGNKLALTPGKTVYFRKTATPSSFKSEIQTLDIPARPLASTFGIDFRSETTDQAIPSSYEFSYYPEMVDAATGSGEKATVTPGRNLYIRVKATSSSFCSEAQIIKVPSRPEKPVFSIDYINEKTIEQVPSNTIYNSSEDTTGASGGSGIAATLTPGVSMYFWTKATDTSFRSNAYMLEVPQRPAELINPFVDLTQRALDWNLSSLYPDINDYEYSYEGENQWFACSNKPLQLKKYTPTTSKIKVRIKANNESGKQRFSSLESIIDNPLIDPAGSEIYVRLYPNPTDDILIMDADPTISARPTMKIMDSRGNIVVSGELVENHKEIDISTLPKGTYVVIVKAGDKVAKQKILKR